MIKYLTVDKQKREQTAHMHTHTHTHTHAKTMQHAKAADSKPAEA